MPHCFYLSPVGELLIAASDGVLTGVWMEGQRFYANTLPPSDAKSEDDAVLQAAKNYLAAYFSGEKPSLGTLALAPAGTAFQKKVWRLLCDIPYGETVTYGTLAERMGGSRCSARSIGMAVSRNPIAILLPCHRVLGKNGGLTGYAGGIERKAWLLRFEKDTADF